MSQKKTMRLFTIALIALYLLVGCAAPRKSVPSLSQITEVKIPFERDSNETVTWAEAIGVYGKFAEGAPKQCQLQTAGPTDCGKPLHVFVLSSDGIFDPARAKAKQKTVILVLNGIHPGEPEGIDASILFARQVLQDPKLQEAYRDLVFLIIPIYNVDGSLNRYGTSRANQNGPKEYGFRGNSRNLDLNRDYIKRDSRNTESLTKLFQAWNPDLVLDNHTSNGADYQYTMTLLPTLHSKLAPVQAQLLNQQILPELNARMLRKGWPMCPYVNEIQATPDSGIVAFMDGPRFGSGYAALFQTITIVAETHMLKPFAQRLRSTQDLMFSLADFTAQNGAAIRASRWEAGKYFADAPQFPLDWSPVLTHTTDSILFRGYEARYLYSQVHKGQRLYYDRQRPFTKNIPFYHTFEAKSSVKRPKAYIIPQAWHEVIERLRQNSVAMYPLANDTAVWVTQYRIKDFKTRDAYEGHYLHYNVRVDTLSTKRKFAAGDMVIPVPEYCNRYDICTARFIVETLEPTAPDSYFAWNFFDGILMQKEYFSDYVFEDLAEELLRANPTVKDELRQKMAAEPEWAKNGDEVLRWVYQRSVYYEPTHRVYPVVRVE
jgi:Zinc carboxypeptidase